FAQPSLCPTDENALFAAKTVQDWRLFSVQAQFVSFISDAQSAEVANVFAQSEGAVYVEVRENLELIVLVDERSSTSFECVAVLLCPPLAHYAVAVESASLIVKSVTDLVTDNRADSPVVHGVFSIEVKVRRLQNGSREYDFIKRWIVVSVYRLRRHHPFVAVNRLA